MLSEEARDADSDTPEEPSSDEDAATALDRDDTAEARELDSALDCCEEPEDLELDDRECATDSRLDAIDAPD